MTSGVAHCTCGRFLHRVGTRFLYDFELKKKKNLQVSGLSATIEEHTCSRKQRCKLFRDCNNNAFSPILVDHTYSHTAELIPETVSYTGNSGPLDLSVYFIYMTIVIAFIYVSLATGSIFELSGT